MTDDASLLESLEEGESVVIDGEMRGTVTEVIDVGGHRQVMVDTDGDGSGAELALFAPDDPRGPGVRLNRLDGVYHDIESLERLD